MKLIRYIFCFIIFNTSYIEGQIVLSIPEIENQIAQADSIYKVNPLEAESLYLTTLESAETINNDSLTLFIVYKFAAIYNQTSRAQKYIDLSSKYLKNFDFYKDHPIKYINSLTLKYSSYLKLGLYNKAMETILIQDSLLNKHTDIDRSIFVPTNLYISNIYSRQDLHQQTINFAKKGLDEILSNNNFQYSYGYKLLYESYFLLDSLELSSEYYKKYIDKLDIHSKSLTFRAYHFSNFHGVMQSFATEEKLLELYESLLQSKNKLSIRNDIGFVLASIYEKKKNYKEAIQYWKSGIIRQSNNDNYNLFPISKIYNTYLKINEIDSAAYYMKWFNKLNKSVIVNKKNKQFEELNAKYQSSLKDAEINKQQAIIEKQKREKHSILAGIIIGLTTLLSVIWFFMTHLKYKKQNAENELKIRNQEISELKKEKKILSMASMIEGQEAERIRISKDLHDGLGGLLSTTKAHFSNIKNEITTPDKKDIYNKANLMIDEACQEIRRISHNLMPATLQLDGLQSAVEQLADDISMAHGFNVSVEFVGVGSQVNEKLEIFIFRIIQEATNNIIKYANAKNVLIQLTEQEKNYNLIIEDDGVGFEKEKTIYGIGLKSIESRVDYLKGDLDISSKINEGTTISINLPKKIKLI